MPCCHVRRSPPERNPACLPCAASLRLNHPHSLEAAHEIPSLDHRIQKHQAPTRMHAVTSALRRITGLACTQYIYMGWSLWVLEGFSAGAGRDWRLLRAASAPHAQRRAALAPGTAPGTVPPEPDFTLALALVPHISEGKGTLRIALLHARLEACWSTWSRSKSRL